MKKQTESTQEYVVRMFRKDGEVLDLLKSDDFKKCKALWVNVTKQWQECHKEAQVFLLEKPIITAFEPGLISEILVLPYTNPVSNIDLTLRSN